MNNNMRCLFIKECRQNVPKEGMQSYAPRNPFLYLLKVLSV